jgi:hypothetical protein
VIILLYSFSLVYCNRKYLATLICTCTYLPCSLLQGLILLGFQVFIAVIVIALKIAFGMTAFDGKKGCLYVRTLYLSQGLPDFAWYHRTKKIQMATKCTKWPQNIPNGCKIFRTATKYINIISSKALQNG